MSPELDEIAREIFDMSVDVYKDSYEVYYETLFTLPGESSRRRVITGIMHQRGREPECLPILVGYDNASLMELGEGFTDEFRGVVTSLAEEIWALCRKEMEGMESLIRAIPDGWNLESWEDIGIGRQLEFSRQTEDCIIYLLTIRRWKQNKKTLALCKGDHNGSLWQDEYRATVRVVITEEGNKSPHEDEFTLIGFAQKYLPSAPQLEDILSLVQEAGRLAAAKLTRIENRLREGLLENWRALQEAVMRDVEACFGEEEEEESDA